MWFGSGLLLFVSTSPRDAAVGAFPVLPSRRTFVSHLRARTARATRGSAAAGTATTTRLAGGLADLYDVTQNADFFPATSGYSALSRLSLAGEGRSGADAPTAEEFLAQLAAVTGRGDVASVSGTMEDGAAEYAAAAANAARDVASDGAGYGDYDASFAASAASPSPPVGGFQGGANSLRDLAANIPVVDRQDVGQATQGIDAGGMSDYYSNVADGGVLPAVPEMQDFADGASTHLGAPPPLPSEYLPVDGTPTPLEGSVDPSLIPQTDGLPDSLSSQLADLSYDGLSGADALASPPKSPPLSDYISSRLGQAELPKVELPKMSIKDKLGDVELPNIKDKLDHLELPKMSNPFSEMELPKVSLDAKMEHVDLPQLGNPFSETHVPKPPPSIKEAFSSVREALPTVADVSNSLETLSQQWAAAGTAARGGVARAADLSNAYSGSFRGHENRVGAAGAAVGEAARAAAARVAQELAAPTLATDAGEGTAASAPPLPPSAAAPPHFALPDLPPSPPDVGDASLANVGNAVANAVHFIGSVLVQFLDLVLYAVAGTTVAALLADVQTSMSSMINDASHAVVSAVDGVANMTVKEILQHLMALLFAVTDVLLKVANAVVYLLTGRDGEGWALQASTSVEAASSQLLAQATHAYNQVTHESIAQLAHSIGDYSNHIGQELLALAGNLHGATDGAASSLDPDTLDKLATAVQTALTL